MKETLTTKGSENMTKVKINKAIKHTGLEVQNNRDGYSYFTNFEGDPIGGCVMVCYLNQLSLSQWIEEAECAVKNPENI